jgi:homoserine O-succinyltransferase
MFALRPWLAEQGLRVSLDTPVIIHSREIHPFLPSLGSPLAIDRSRAEQQDIRPLEIAIINLMADK